MRFEVDHSFSDAEASGHRPTSQSDEAFPPQLAFLRHEVDHSTLLKAAQVARRLKVCAASALIADGHVSASRYYRALARHLDLDFIDGWPEIESGIDIFAAHSIGVVRLADTSAVRWLAAPRDENLRGLLSKKSRGVRRSDLAITTPAHFASIVHFHSQPSVERAVRDALPDETPRLSARGALEGRIGMACAIMALGSVVAAILVPRVVCFGAGLLFFFGVCFRLIVSAKGLDSRDGSPPRLADSDLPDYTVLVPLRDKGDILPDLLVALEAIDYPRAKLDVLVLIEPEDHRTRAALAKACLPPWLHVVFGPWGGSLRTKPRALNIGLLMARGDLLTVYDAEDQPEPNQLRLAAAMFASASKRTACFQARLAIDNGSNSLLARLFAIEYALLFDVLNIGIGRLGLPLALGGTSNHFKTSLLREAGGWDAWNVTEDADLGLRLARLGFDVACLPSTTFESAPERPGAWMRQRRRWMKGWMQTLLVLARDAPHVVTALGFKKSGAVVLLFINLVAGPLLFPIFSVYVTYRFVHGGVSSPSGALEIFEATLEAAVVLFGVASMFWCSYVGVRARKLRAFTSSLPLMLPYQLMISTAAWSGLLDLIVRPHHWHKTTHNARGGDVASGSGARKPD